MHRAFLALFFSLSLYAAKINIYSNNIQKTKDIIRADDGVIVISKLYYISAKRALYNESSKDLELFGDVNIIRGENERSLSSYALLKLKNDEASFKDFFFANTQLEVWLKAKSSCFKEDIFSAQKSIVSSCDVNNPDWKIEFKRGYLSNKDRVLTLYGAKFFIKNLPLLYLPYFSFSTSKDRRSGLLVPKINIKNKDGLYYKQPIYFALNDHSDLLLSPQLRSKRGGGVSAEYRFLNKSSMLFLDLGFYDDKNSYLKEESLKNKRHYGLRLKYSQNELVKKLAKLDKKWQEGLWVDANYLNDIDYLNLSNQSNYTSLVSSSLNYFLSGGDDYFGLYFKHYIDTSKLSNKNTLQEYPSLQYHRFLKKIFLDTLSYNFDASFRNHFRREGLKARQFEFGLPLSYKKSFFNDYVNILLTQSLYANLVNYSKYYKKEESLVQSFHELSFYTELAKRYKDFAHSMDFSLSYFLPGLNKGKITKAFLKNISDTKNINAKFLQYFYDKNGYKKLRHLIGIKYLLENKYKDVDYINELTYFLNEDFYLSNELEYDGKKDSFNKVFSELGYSDAKIKLALAHSYRLYEDKKYNYLGAKFKYKLNTNYEFFSSLSYGLNNPKPNMWQLGYSFKKKCWSYSLLYKVSTEPKLTSAGINAKSEKGFYFIFNFYPLGGISYDFSLEERESKI